MRRIVVLFLAVMSWHVSAQISLTDASDYSENFDSYLGSLATVPSGWNTNGGSFRGTDDGGNNSGGRKAFGVDGGSEWSLGGLPSNSAGDITHSVEFTNNTGETITELTINYDFEQWRYANTVGFLVDGTGGLSSADLSGLNQGAAATGTNGTVTVTPKTITLMNLSIANGSNFGIEWTHLNGAGSDSGVSVDNFSLTQIVLPVELLSFSATPLESQVKLSWSTASELNNDYFIVQAQDNSSEWIDLGMVQGAGTSSTVIEYRFMDDRRIAGDQFYRLMQVDLDGSITYSGVERVTITGTYLKWPTLVSNYLRTDIAGSYSIYSGQGQMIITEESIDGTVDVSSLSSGAYILRASGITHRFIKQ